MLNIWAMDGAVMEFLGLGLVFEGLVLVVGDAYVIAAVEAARGSQGPEDPAPAGCPQVEMKNMKRKK